MEASDEKDFGQLELWMKNEAWKIWGKSEVKLMVREGMWSYVTEGGQETRGCLF